MKTVTIYTDGSCRGNPGPGSWAANLSYDGHEKYIRGDCEDTTNNRMELQAVISGLRALKYPCNVELYSDSQYIVNAFNKGWLSNWKRFGWTTSAGSPVKNQDMWEELCILTKKHNVKFHWVKGHSSNHKNNAVDNYARYGKKAIDILPELSEVDF